MRPENLYLLTGAVLAVVGNIFLLFVDRSRRKAKAREKR